MQLIIDVGGYALKLPESQNMGYTVDEEDIGQDIIMLPGNMVRELRGKVWRITYQYGYLSDEEKTRFINACRKGKNEPIICSFLVPETNESLVSEFFVTAYTRPKFMWSRDGKPIWGDYNIELREVDPHD